jgi:hypothetical protein
MRLTKAIILFRDAPEIAFSQPGFEAPIARYHLVPRRAAGGHWQKT